MPIKESVNSATHVNPRADPPPPRNLIISTDPTLQSFLNTSNGLLPPNDHKKNAEISYPSLLTPISPPIRHKDSDSIIDTHNEIQNPVEKNPSKYHIVLVPNGYRTIVVPEDSSLDTPHKMSYIQPLSECRVVSTSSTADISALPIAQHCAYTTSPQKKTVNQKRIPRPANSFMTYRMDKQHEVLAQNPNANNRDISIIVGQMWRNESEKVKELYRQKAENGRKEHMLRYPNYKYVPSKKRKDLNPGSGVTKRKEYPTITSEVSPLEELPHALTCWTMVVPHSGNCAHRNSQDGFIPEIINPVNSVENVQDHHIGYQMDDGSIKYINSMELHRPMAQQHPPHDICTYPTNIQPIFPQSGSFDLNLAAAPQISNTAAAFGTGNLCSIQSLMSFPNSYIQNDDLYSPSAFL